jgi:hypothetical protein
VHVLAAHGEIISTRTLCPAGRNPEWEQLRDHLRLVTETCARFAGTFGWAELARVAGLLHDTENAPKSFRPISRGRGLFWRALFQQRRGRSPSPRGSVMNGLPRACSRRSTRLGGSNALFPRSRALRRAAKGRAFTGARIEIFHALSTVVW